MSWNRERYLATEAYTARLRRLHLESIIRQEQARRKPNRRFLAAFSTALRVIRARGDRVDRLQRRQAIPLEVRRIEKQAGVTR